MLAENDLIFQEGPSGGVGGGGNSSADSTYTLVTQRDPEQKVRGGGWRWLGTGIGFQFCCLIVSAVGVALTSLFSQRTTFFWYSNVQYLQ